MTAVGEQRAGVVIVVQSPYLIYSVHLNDLTSNGITKTKILKVYGLSPFKYFSTLKTKIESVMEKIEDIEGKIIREHIYMKN